MWFSINLESFAIDHTGFNHKTVDAAIDLYASNNLIHLTHIHQLKNSEYGQMISVDTVQRRILFGRDYLGHYPLLYACFDNTLIISDSIQKIVRWSRDHHHRLTFSEQAVALYFSMGYVPQGMTLFREIHSCENASIYHWENQRVWRENIFTPIEIEPNFETEEIRRQIEGQIKQIASQYAVIDVWCSGGIDSSIMATSCRRYSEKTELLTLGYDEEVIARHGESELPFVRAVAQYCDLKLRYAILDRHAYREIFHDFCVSFPLPGSEICTPPKYMLANQTREVAITGEGGDPLFAGIKNDFVHYMRQKFPTASLGWLYALSHKRHFQNLDQILHGGEALKGFVTDYFTEMLNRYPGALIRKLFYMNTFLKQGSLIFLESYYAGQRSGVQVRHPLTSLAVYQAAFRLEDHHKYCYPQGKIALSRLYKDQLPSVTIERKKSGTRLPMMTYVSYLAEAGSLDHYFLPLREIPYLKESWIESMLASLSTQEPHFVYMLITLGGWLSHLFQGDHYARVHDLSHVCLPTECSGK